MKKHNPSIPIMLREAQGTLPKVYARYDFGKEKSQSLEGTNVVAHEIDPVVLCIGRGVAKGYRRRRCLLGPVRGLTYYDRIFGQAN